MALTYISNGKIVLPNEVVVGKALAFDGESGRIVGLVEDRVTLFIALARASF